ncbi:hypothetical protein HPP92_006461 [Vanilla planifolia]|uniref:Uncharacterized protein n=1 Tax=Vanilla planifolia TaxID=51239 RepID=A0A835RFN7_VANPL|nr:hypothetical protein HPP92_006461 [Vanilla planifolia]
MKGHPDHIRVSILQYKDHPSELSSNKARPLSPHKRCMGIMLYSIVLLLRRLNPDPAFYYMRLQSRVQKVTQHGLQRQTRRNAVKELRKGETEVSLKDVLLHSAAVGCVKSAVFEKEKDHGHEGLT